VRRMIGIAFLLLQLGTIVHAQFVPTRWFCWAPNDYAVWYRIEVRINGVALSPSQIERRYELDAEHVYQDAAANLMDIIRQRETTYGRQDHATVTLLYRPSGGELREWRWPPQ
jgi:hypothetical protein